MTYVFVDGTPLDATALNKLVQDFDKLRTSMPKVGSASLLENSENARPTEMYGGKTDTQTVKTGTKATFTLNYKGAFTYVPKSVVATIFSNTGDITDEMVSVAVGSIELDKATAYVYVPGNGSKTVKLSLNYFAISHS